VGSVSDVVIDGTNGLLVQPTVDALAAGISQLVADEQLRVRLGAEGKRVASVQFSITAAQERHRAMYRKLVSGR
ncbi:MAG: glycosyltransferase, partial [Ilumatobacteraceae bacterium]